MYLLAMTAQEGLTFDRILADIPHDGAAIFIYALTIGSLWFLWWANRNSGKNGSATPPTESESGRAPTVTGEVEPGAPERVAANDAAAPARRRPVSR